VTDPDFVDKPLVERLIDAVMSADPTAEVIIWRDEVVVHLLHGVAPAQNEEPLHTITASTLLDAMMDATVRLKVSLPEDLPDVDTDAALGLFLRPGSNPR
jgi:molybdopterin-guanine dinucleotide biosynthesis protein A